MDMTNNFFDLLGIDWEELYEKFMNLQNTITNKYNDIVKNIKKYDLDTEEGYENFIKDAAEFRKELEKDDSVFNKKLVQLLDKCVKDAMEMHEEKKNSPKSLKEELVDTEVNRNINENYGRINLGKKEYEAPTCTCKNKLIDKPSDHLTYSQRKSVLSLVDKYMEDMVEPYLPENTSDEVKDNMASGLFEFGAWLLNR